MSDWDVLTAKFTVDAEGCRTFETKKHKIAITQDVVTGHFVYCIWSLNEHGGFGQLVLEGVATTLDGAQTATLYEIAYREEIEIKHFSLVTEQKAPVGNDNPAVWDLVKADMTARDAEGRKKYGVPLQPHNGRDPLVDAYQECLDQSVYLRQAIYERDGK